MGGAVWWGMWGVVVFREDAGAVVRREYEDRVDREEGHVRRHDGGRGINGAELDRERGNVRLASEFVVVCCTLEICEARRTECQAPNCLNYPWYHGHFLHVWH